jgi:hypothetical protein
MDTFNELSTPGYPNVNHGKHSSPSNLRILLMSFQNFIAAHTPTAMVLSASANIRFDPVVSSLVNSISLNQMRDDIRWLTGEDGKSGIISRHSFAEGSRVAATWLKERFEETGANCELKLFISGFAPNVAW